MRLIDADEVQNLLDKESKICNSGLIYGELKFLKGCVNTIPTISPDSLRPKGRWIIIDDDYSYNWDEGDEIYVVLECECSACKQRARGETNFCPNCGADTTGDVQDV